MRAKLIELFTRAITVSDVKKKIYHNGADNNYPERIERVENNSVTAKLASAKLADFIIGFGFEGDVNDKIANPKKGYTYYDILCLMVNDLKTHRGCSIYVNYNAENEVNCIDVLPYKNCRKSKEDDLDYPGIIYYRNTWEEKNSLYSDSRKYEKWYYPFDNDPNIISAQRKKDAGFKRNVEIKVPDIETLVSSYRGQVLTVNLDKNTIYPLSFIDAAYNDADTEYRISQFRNDQVRNGFIGATIVTIAEGDGEDEIVTDKQLKGLLGSDNASNILKIEAKLDADQKLEDVINIKTVTSSIDTDRFKNDEYKIESNILNSYGVPKELIKGNDGALFSANADSLQFLKEEFNDSTEKYRKLIEDSLFKVLGNRLKIKPLIEKNQDSIVGNELDDQEDIEL